MPKPKRPDVDGLAIEIGAPSLGASAIRRHPFGFSQVQDGVLPAGRAALHASTFALQREPPAQLADLAAKLSAFGKPPLLFALAGPFGYEQLKNIELLLVDQNATVYFNRYFQDISGSYPNHRETIYQKYFATLPVEHTPAPPVRSGSTTVWPPIPAAPGMPLLVPTGLQARGILLGLNTISYSGRYGGSIRLHFSMIEHVGAEFSFRDAPAPPSDVGSDDLTRGSGFLVDCSMFELSIYLVPDKAAFNGLNANTSSAFYNAPAVIEARGSVETVLRWRVEKGVASYEVPNDGDAAAATQMLEEAIAAFGNALASRIEVRKPLGRFIVGFVHNENLAILASDDEVVDDLAIGDGTLDLWTHTREWLFEIRCRVQDLWLDTEPGAEEIDIQVEGAHDFYGVEQGVAQRLWHKHLPAQGPFSDRPKVTTDWYRIGKWKFDEIFEGGADGKKVQSTDENGELLTFPSGEPCYVTRLNHMLALARVRIVETDDPFGSNNFVVWYNDSVLVQPSRDVGSEWAEVYWYYIFRAWNDEFGEGPCSYEEKLDEMVRRKVPGLVASRVSQIWIENGGRIGYYRIRFELNLSFQ